METTFRARPPIWRMLQSRSSVPPRTSSAPHATAGAEGGTRQHGKKMRKAAMVLPRRLRWRKRYLARWRAVGSGGAVAGFPSAGCIVFQVTRGHPRPQVAEGERE